MKYIGIQGYRGAGKETWSFLLGSILDYLIQSENDKCDLNIEEINKIYDNAVEAIYCNPQFLQDSEFNHVYIASFSDTSKALLHLMTNIPMEYMYDSEYKSNTYINLKTFEYVEGVIDPSELNIISAQSLWDKKLKDIHFINNPYNPSPLEDEWMQLKEFLMYYGHFVMKNFLGKNIWVKSLDSVEEEDEYFIQDNSYKIFNDVKFESEVKYIKEHGGVIIYIDRPKNVKKDFIPIDKIQHPDYTIRVDTNNLEDLSSEAVKSQVIELALSIYTLN